MKFGGLERVAWTQYEAALRDLAVPGDGEVLEGLGYVRSLETLQRHVDTLLVALKLLKRLVLICVRQQKFAERLPMITTVRSSSRAATPHSVLSNKRGIHGVYVLHEMHLKQDVQVSHN